MSLRPLIIILLFACFQVTSGQINRFGAPEVIHYPPEITMGSEQNWSVARDNRGIMYFGNDEQGVLQYDGNEWRAIPIPNKSYVRSLACSDEGTIYVGAVSEFGYLRPDATGKMAYVSLLPKLDYGNMNFTDVWKTHATKDKIYFVSQNITFIYYPDSDSLKAITNIDNSLFGFYELDNLFISNFNQGLLRMERDFNIVHVKGGDYYVKKNIFALTTYDDDHLLICANGFGLSLFNVNTGEVNDRFAKKETNDYLNENFVTLILRLSTGNFAATTQYGGLVVIDREGRITEIINEFEGNQAIVWSAAQPDTSYPYSHLWTALDFGIGKINIDSPLRYFTEETGYTGLITTINSLDGKIFLGTMNGLYAYEVIDNQAAFKKISNIRSTVRKLEKFKLDSGEEVLLSIGESGFFLIHSNGKAENLKEKIEGLKNEEQRIFWGYNLYKDPQKKGRIILGQDRSAMSILYSNGIWKYESSIESLKSIVTSIERSSSGTLFFGTDLNGLGSMRFLNEGMVFRTFGTENGLPQLESNVLFNVNGETMVGTIDGIFRIDETKDPIHFYRDTIYNRFLPNGENRVFRMHVDSDSTVWISYHNENTGWRIMGLQKTMDESFEVISWPFMNLENFSTDAFYSTVDAELYFSRSKRLYRFDIRSDFDDRAYPVLIRKITVNQDSIIYNGAKSTAVVKNESDAEESQIRIRHYENDLDFFFSAPFFEHENKTEYSYFLEGYSSTWTAWQNRSKATFTNLPSGKYVFRVKARNVFEYESTPAAYAFTILPPWYLKWYAIVGYVIIIFFIFYFFYILSHNQRLKLLVSERTREITAQKEEIETQRDLVFEKNKEITDSINYAKRIQTALLPDQGELDEILPDHFVMFKPRDIVSGDFYWIKQIKSFIVIAIADCTGHGVPGAFMSMMGVSLLNELVSRSRFDASGEILDRLRKKVKTTLSQEGRIQEQKDGMDIALIILDTENGELQFSGAFNPLYIIRDKTLVKADEMTGNVALVSEKHVLYEVKADRQPISIYSDEKKFTTHCIKLKESDTLYMFTDGFADQIGGPKGKKFMVRKFKKLLLGIQHENMAEQKNLLNLSLKEWMQDENQLDDILVFGMKWSPTTKPTDD